MTSSEICVSTSYFREGSFGHWFLPSCVYSHGITMLIGIYVALDFKFILIDLFSIHHI